MRYRNACLRLFVVVLQDSHCLQRFYHNVDHWCIHHTTFHILVELLLVRHSNPCLRLFVVIKCKKHFIKMLKDVGMVLPKIKGTIL